MLGAVHQLDGLPEQVIPLQVGRHPQGKEGAGHQILHIPVIGPGHGGLAPGQGMELSGRFSGIQRLQKAVGDLVPHALQSGGCALPRHDEELGTPQEGQRTDGFHDLQAVDARQFEVDDQHVGPILHIPFQKLSAIQQNGQHAKLFPADQHGLQALCIFHVRTDDTKCLHVTSRLIM